MSSRRPASSRTWRDWPGIARVRNGLLRLAHELDPNAGAMSEDALQAYLARRSAELPERRALRWRYDQAIRWMESNFNSLSHRRRHVEHLEALVQAFREEERDREPCRRTRNRQPFQPHPPQGE